MKKKSILIILVIFFNSGFIQAQSDLNLSSLKNPVYTGDRELTFNINGNGNDFEIWVFYSSKASDLNSVNFSSVGSSNIPYGRATMVKEGSHVICHFVFPHTMHPSTPNKEYYEMSLLSNVPGMIKLNGYSSILDLFGFPGQNPTSIVFDKNPKKFTKNQCVFYKVVKKVKISAVGNFNDVSTTRKFAMPDAFTIGIAGDSYGSGEGAPMDDFELIGNNEDMWTACNCHRSEKSGLMRGVKKFIHRFPEVAVEYSFVACSGAVTGNLFEEPAQVSEQNYIPNSKCGSTPNPLQFNTIKKELITDGKHDKLNMLILNIGGNNTGFADVVKNFLVFPRNLAIESVAYDPLSAYAGKIAELDEDYEKVDTKIAQIFNQSNPFVGICTYPNPTKGKHGRCGCNIIESLDYHCCWYENDCLYSPQAEYQIISDRFVTPLNAKVRSTAKFGWQTIEIESEAGEHGLCNCDDPYYNGTVPRSIASQGDPWGMVHPNSKGYDEMYTDKVFAFVNSSYQQFKLNYAMAVILGLVPQPPPCESNTTHLVFDALWYLMSNEKTVAATPGFNSWSVYLKDEKLIMAMQSGSEKEIEANPAYQKLIKDVSLKNSFMAVKGTEYAFKPKVFIPKTFPPGKGLGPVLTKLKKENEDYVNTPKYKEDQVEAKKIKPLIKQYVNPLDKAYKMD